MRPIGSPNELYAHAIALEREAAERYGEFARRMADLGNQAAEVFVTLARLEEEHLETLLTRTRGVEIPGLPHRYAWLDAGAPETAAREMAAEEGEHIALIERLLERTRQPGLDSQVIFER